MYHRRLQAYQYVVIQLKYIMIKFGLYLTNTNGKATQRSNIIDEDSKYIEIKTL